MPKNSFIHTPDEFLQCGALGEFPATFIASIHSDQDRFGWSYKARIVSVKLSVEGDGLRFPELDVTNIFLARPWLREEWEKKIETAYARAHERTIDDEFENATNR